MKTLLLLRHAKSSSAHLLKSDKDRVLSARGRADCAKVGAELGVRKMVPDLILCSSAQRARETTELVLDGLRTSNPLINIPVQYEEEMYLAEPATILAHAQGAPEEVATLMLIGHNPGFAALAFALAGGNPMSDEISNFPTATVAAFDFEAKHWTAIDPTRAKLSQFFAPIDLVD